MNTATLTKWGNSQGIIIPKATCERLGISVGDPLNLSIRDGKLEITPAARYRRTKRTSIDQLFADWHGTYTPPTDYPTSGNEIDWGEPVGSEAL